MYYTINEQNQQIIDSSSTCPDPQEQADDFGCRVYIIRGAHSGLEAAPQRGSEGDLPTPVNDERMNDERMNELARRLAAMPKR